MAHARKGGISHSPGQRFAAPKQRYAPPEWWFALGRTKAITPNRPERAAIPRQKTPLGGLAAVFSSLAVRKRDYGASRSALESQEKPEKERRSAKSDRKAPNGGPECHAEPMQRGPLAAFPAILRAKPCNRRFPAKKPAKRYEHLAGFDPNRPRTASSLPAAALRRG